MTDNKQKSFNSMLSILKCLPQNNRRLSTTKPHQCISILHIFPNPNAMKSQYDIWMNDAWNPEDSAHPRKMIFSVFRYQRAFLIYNAVRRSHKRSFSTEFPSRDKVVGEQQSKGFFVPFKFHNRCVRLSGVYLMCSLSNARRRLKNLLGYFPAFCQTSRRAQKFKLIASVSAGQLN